MFQKHTFSPEEMRFVGMGLTALALIFLASTVWRWESMCQAIFIKRLLRWGRGRWSFPASRLGAFAGGSVALVFGLICVDVAREQHRQAWITVFAAVMVFVIIAAIHDYISHRRNRD